MLFNANDFDDYFDAPQLEAKPKLLNSTHSFKSLLQPVNDSWSRTDVALIGIPYDVNSEHNKGCAAAPDVVRAYLYELLGDLDNIYVSDLGNIKPVQTQNELQFILTEVLEQLSSLNIIPIFIGGSHDITHPIAENIIAINDKIKMTVIDACIDAKEKEDYTDHTFLSHLLRHKQVSDFTIIGHQGYLSDISALVDIEGTVIDLLSVGELRNDASVAEPYLRDSNFVSIDMAAVRYSDSPGNGYVSPNGLYAEELCKLCRLAGYSDTLKYFGIFGYNPSLDQRGISAQLTAQAIWFLLEGLDNRQKDYPLRNINTYQKKIIHLEDIDRDIVFYQNIQNNRWWFNATESLEDDAVISCTFQDFLKAQKGDLSDRLMKHLR